LSSYCTPSGFDQCYNAQAAVATGSMLIVATEVTQAANDKEQLVPMIEKLKALPEAAPRSFSRTTGI
jgi:hypothetical protein